MAETLCISDRRLLTWNPDKDRLQWLARLEEFGGQTAVAVLHFGRTIRDNLTAFIAELRPGQEQQLLRPYSYQLSEIDSAVVNRADETKGISNVEDRSLAIAKGIQSVHEFFRSAGNRAQAVLMSPVNEATGQPEFLHTAIYFLTHQNGIVTGWQLFVDFSAQERKDYMARVSRRAGSDYSATDDLELASTPVVSSSSQPLYSSIEDFIADTAGFLKSVRDRASISGISLAHPAEFVENQLRLEDKNHQEALNWVEPYIRAIAQGSIDLARRIITNLQLKVLNLTESAVRTAARLASVDFSALQVFLRACGFLSFSFSPEIPAVSPQSIFAIPAIGGHCQEKICRRCGTHAGDEDRKCPSCGWSP